MAGKGMKYRIRRLWVNLLIIGLAVSLAAGASYGLRWLGY